MTQEEIRKYLAAIGAKGGKMTTPKQAAARKRNGKKGGRPKGAKDSKPRKRKG